MLLYCRDCTTAYAVGLHRCPHCTSERVSREPIMPKITVHGGPSNAADLPAPEPVDVVPEQPEPQPEQPEPKPARARPRARKAR